MLLDRGWSAEQALQVRSTQRLPALDTEWKINLTPARQKHLIRWPLRGVNDQHVGKVEYAMARSQVPDVHGKGD